jgi:D-arabinose 1-dehydrogenase-like Zn-dependent alcohol dehydrogenase
MRSFQVQQFGKPLAEVIAESPHPQGSQVLVKIAACGVCHSDVHLHDGYFDLGDGKKVDMTRAVAPPRTLGHEIVGTVAAVGPDAKGVAVGERRVVYPWIGCGECSLCQAGNEHLCNAPRALGINRDGGFADHVMVSDPKYLLAFDPLPEEQACTYACSGLTAASALKKAGQLGPKDPLLIIGAGGVGLSGIRLAKTLCGVAPIVAEIDKNKWDVAREAGAAEVIDPSADGVAKSLFKSTGGGVAAAIDFVGAAATFAFGFNALRKAGKLIVVGLFGGSTPISPAMVSMTAKQVMGSYVGSLDEMHELMRIARSGSLPALPVATRPLDQVNAALTDLREGRVRGRVVLKV